MHIKVFSLAEDQGNQLRGELQLEKDKNKALHDTLDKLLDAFNALKTEHEQLKDATGAKEEQQQGTSYQTLQHELHKTADEKNALANEYRDLREKLHHQNKRTSELLIQHPCSHPEYITSELMTHRSDAGYSADNILSQCYDGASVMSGVRGGVQALLQKKLARYVPYIHCYNHQLHLVVVHAMQSEPCARRFFDLSGSLYKFFQHHHVSQKYDAPHLKRLLEIRWTSHYEVTRCIVENQDHILSVLSEMTEDDDVAVDLCTEESGLLCQIKRHHFFETGTFLVRVLGVLKPANAILQSQSVDMCRASEVVGAALESLKDIREDEYWAELSQVAAEDDSNPPKRRRTMSKHLSQSAVLSTVGHTDSDNPALKPHQSLKRALLNILDISEMETRFSQRNIDLMTAISSLAPKSSEFLDSTLLHPLAMLAGTVADNASLKNEILVAKKMLMKKCPNESDLSSVCKHIQEYKDAFPVLHKLYVTALVVGVSSADLPSPHCHGF
ncbi:uncharacterized protein V6R79_016961 [Siganus canaliculatus]